MGREGGVVTQVMSTLGRRKVRWQIPDLLSLSKEGLDFIHIQPPQMVIEAVWRALSAYYTHREH